jgi:hypothetical protein
MDLADSLSLRPRSVESWTVTQEMSAKSLSFSITTSSPDNATIRSKVPGFRITSSDNHMFPANSYYQTAEVLSDSASELNIRTKIFNSSNVLGVQTDSRYTRFNQ